MCQKHGYIIGEAFKCPMCGGPTEVYSRITGYYRPVQNWNDGKVEEYHARKVYNVERSAFYNRNSQNNKVQTSDTPCTNKQKENATLLFTTATCPNCKIATGILDKFDVDYELILAEDRPELAESFGIQKAPTLVTIKDGVISKYENVSEITRFVRK